jgi:hypothetical protein
LLAVPRTAAHFASVRIRRALRVDHQSLMNRTVLGAHLPCFGRESPLRLGLLTSAVLVESLPGLPGTTAPNLVPSHSSCGFPQLDAFALSETAAPGCVPPSPAVPVLDHNDACIACPTLRTSNVPQAALRATTACSRYRLAELRRGSPSRTMAPSGAVGSAPAVGSSTKDRQVPRAPTTFAQSGARTGG